MAQLPGHTTRVGKKPQFVIKKKLLFRALLVNI